MSLSPQFGAQLGVQLGEESEDGGGLTFPVDVQYDFSRPETLTVVNDGVSDRISDVQDVGEGFVDLYQDTVGRRPIYDSTLNGLQCARVASGDGWVSLPSNNLLANVTGYMVVMVLDPKSASNEYPLEIRHESNNASVLTLNYLDPTSFRTINKMNSTAGTSTNIFPFVFSGTPQVLSAAVDHAANTVEVRINGTSLGVQTLASGTPGGSTSGESRLIKGYPIKNGSGSPSIGRHGEMIITKDYSAQRLNELEGYMAHKWGLVDALDPAHPYKGAPP